LNEPQKSLNISSLQGKWKTVQNSWGLKLARVVSDKNWTVTQINNLFQVVAICSAIILNVTLGIHTVHSVSEHAAPCYHSVNIIITVVIRDVNEVQGKL